MKYSKQGLKSHKKLLLWLGVNILLLLIFLLCLGRYNHLAQELVSQQAAERWAGQSDMQFAQVSCFLPVNSTLTEAEIATFRTKAEQALDDASVEPATENGALYADAYCSFGQLTASGDYGSTTASAVAVSGDWFLFHPLQLLSGSYISSSDLMQDRVVLDREAAFKLFGAVDVAGMTVTINKQPYLVAGVVEREQDPWSSLANVNSATIFVSRDGGFLKDQPITCYELVMAEPLSGFTAGIIRDNFPLGQGVVVENGQRYKVKAIDDLIWKFGQRAIADNGVAYPWWENAARISEAHLALNLGFMGLTAICPLVWAIILIFRGGKLVKARIAARRARYDYENRY